MKLTHEKLVNFMNFFFFAFLKSFSVYKTTYHINVFSVLPLKEIVRLNFVCSTLYELGMPYM